MDMQSTTTEYSTTYYLLTALFNLNDSING